MRRLLVTIAATAVILGLGAATATAKHRGWGGKPAGSIVDVAVKASSANGPDANPYDYDLLIAAVTATGLAPTLDDESQRFTVFAPNDRAFQRLVRDLTGSGSLPSEQEALDAVLATFSAEQITDILLYHVVAGRVLGPLQVLFAGKLTMANGGIVKPRLFRLVDETPALRDPRLVLRAIDIRATNGVIHTIDRVLVPAA
ncbi:MAG: fasciclin domain-containing protein [Solirubrobacteraceae bacterium]